MDNIDKKRPFPTDWGEWHHQWNAWLNSSPLKLGTTKLVHEDPNFLAEHVLGIFKVWPDQLLFELSEVVFLDHTRYIGVTPMSFDEIDGVQIDLHEREHHSTVVATFAELEDLLFGEDR